LSSNESHYWLASLSAKRFEAMTFARVALSFEPASMSSGISNVSEPAAEKDWLRVTNNNGLRFARKPLIFRRGCGGAICEMESLQNQRRSIRIADLGPRGVRSG